MRLSESRWATRRSTPIKANGGFWKAYTVVTHPTFWFALQNLSIIGRTKNKYRTCPLSCNPRDTAHSKIVYIWYWLGTYPSLSWECSLVTHCKAQCYILDWGCIKPKCGYGNDLDVQRWLVAGINIGRNGFQGNDRGRFIHGFIPRSTGGLPPGLGT